MPNILKRGLFHIVGGLSICVAGLFLPKMALLISLSVTTSIFLTFEFVRFRALVLNNWFLSNFKVLLREEEKSRLTGTSYMLIASLIAFLAFDRDVAILALSFLAVGDAMAAIVGTLAGKRRLLSKTLEGDLACFVSCIATGFVYYYAGLDIELLAVLLGSCAATIIEAVYLHVNDNLTIPLFSGLVMTLIEL